MRDLSSAVPIGLRAVVKRPVLVAATAACGLVLGVLASRAVEPNYVAKAMFVVEERRDENVAASVTSESPDRFVNEELAVFDLESLHRKTAEIATQRLDTLQRRARQGQVTVGPDGGVVLGLNGSARLAKSDPTVVLDAGGAVWASGSPAPSLSAEGTVRGANGTALVNGDGSPLVVRATDTAVVRDDGVIVIVRPDSSPLVVAPPDQVVNSADLAAAIAPVPTADGATTTTTAASSPAQLVPGISRTSSGTVLVSFGSRSLRIEPSLAPVVLDASGQPIGVPGGNDFVGLGQRLILLGRDGAVVARSDNQTIAVEPQANEVVVVGRDGTLAGRTPGATVESPNETPPERIVLDAGDVDQALQVRVRPNSNLIEVRYSADDPVVAKEAANSAVEAYIQLRRSDAGTTNSAAQIRAQDAIATLSTELANTQRQLLATKLANPDRQALDAQYSEIQRELARAGRQLIDNPARDAISSQRVRDLNAQLDAIEDIERMELQSPALADLTGRQTQLRTRLDQLHGQLDSLRVDPGTKGGNVALSSPADQAEVAAGIGDASKLGALGLVLGLLVAAGVAYQLELRRRPTLETVDDAAGILGAPLLSEIPDFRHERIRSPMPVADAPRTFVAEAFRIAAAALTIDLPENRGSVIGVVSAGVGDGKTTLVTNLAAALAQTSRRVLTLDADLEGQVTTMLLQRQVDAERHWPGMIDIIEDGRALEDTVEPIVLGPDMQIDLLSAGAGGMRLRGIFDTDDVRRLFDEMRQNYDVVLVDIPPVLNVSYGALLLREVDAAVVVAAEASPVRAIQELHDRLRLVRVRLVGFVYNRAPFRPERTASIAAVHYDAATAKQPWWRRHKQAPSWTPARRPEGGQAPAARTSVATATAARPPATATARTSSRPPVREGTNGHSNGHVSAGKRGLDSGRSISETNN